MRIAISGKGGVGKTTLAAWIARLLVKEGQNVLAIDADPTNNLAPTLGFPPELYENIVPLKERSNLIEERVGAQGGFFRLNPKVDDLLPQLAVEYQGIKLIVMGTIKEAGGGCACPENTLLRAFIGHLLVEKGESVIVDMEAGLEHLGRRTVEAVDALLVVVEPSQNSIMVAKKIKELAEGLGLKKSFFVANKINSAEEELFIRARLPEEHLLGYLPYSESLRRQALSELSESSVLTRDARLESELKNLLHQVRLRGITPGN